VGTRPSAANTPGAPFARIVAVAISEVIDCVVAMNDKVGDEAARKFSASFYRAIGSGFSVRDAFEHGRVAIDLDDLGGVHVPELFTRPGVNAEDMYLVRSP